VADLVGQQREPGQVQQTGPAEGDHAVEKGPPAIGGVAVESHAGEQGHARSQPVQQGPVVGVQEQGERHGEAGRYRRRRYTKACRKQAVATRPSSTTRVYIRVSLANWARKGLTATRATAIQPDRRPNRVDPAHNATGTQARANSSDRMWVEAPDDPKARIHPWRST
jgi:hypothetical protein